MRKAEELSTTVQPAAEEMGAYFLEMEPPALNRAMSRPSKLQGQWWRRGVGRAVGDGTQGVQGLHTANCR